ncbi:MAG TPA: cysteine rich repeat-containing protein [Burkholderiales bacterium]|nr:cysteine rich repeat-containing protein [Burkholderiales bacterium]
MSIRSALFSTAFALVAVSAAMSAHAQRKGDGPCAEDYKKFCADVKPGQGRLHRCIESHQAELSPACQARIKQATERLQNLAKACKADAEKYCKGVRRGGGRILSCLKGHEADLDPACAAEFKRAGRDPAVVR